MSEIDTAALRAAAEAATPGPWRFSDSGEGEFYGYDDEHGDDVFLVRRERYCNEYAKVDGTADAEYIAATGPDVVLVLLDRIETLQGWVTALEDARASEWDASAPMPETTTPGWGTEDYRRHAVLFNDIGKCRTQIRLGFSDRMRLQRHLWDLGWRRDVRREDATERRGALGATNNLQDPRIDAQERS